MVGRGGLEYGYCTLSGVVILIFASTQICRTLSHVCQLSSPSTSHILIPGRYFACSTHMLAVNIISKRMAEEHPSKSFMYYVNDGVYGSFNCILYDHVTPTPAVLEVCVCVWGGGY